MNLRTGLGRYVPRDNVELTTNALTLHDLGELIRRAGLRSGFIVETQFSVPRGESGKNVRKVDFVWLDESRPQKPVVAFELEGRDVYPQSLKNDVSRLRASDAKLKVLALYQVDHDRTMMGSPPYGCAPKAWVKRHVGAAKIVVFLDEELMAKDGIERVVTEARELAPRR